MNLPAHITRQQITEAFAAMGLDIGEVLILTWETNKPWLEIDFHPHDSHRCVDYIAAKIPIVDAAPPDADDLPGELQRGEGGEA